MKLKRPKAQVAKLTLFACKISILPQSYIQSIRDTIIHVEVGKI